MIVLPKPFEDMIKAGVAAKFRKELVDAGSGHAKEPTIVALANTLMKSGICSTEQLIGSDAANLAATLEGEVALIKLLSVVCKHLRAQSTSCNSSNISASAEEIRMSIGITKNRKPYIPFEKPVECIVAMESAYASSSISELEQQRELLRIDSLSAGMSSLRETSSVLKCWERFSTLFAFATPGKELPPSIDGLPCWSRMFRNWKTYRNYLGKLRLACELAKVDTTAFNSPSIRRAKRILRNSAPLPKPQSFIVRSLLERLVTVCALEGDQLSAMLYVFAYAFRLRVPSEALPVCIGQAIEFGRPLLGAHSRLVLDDKSIKLQPAKRKNLPHGSTITRLCWCKTSSTTCPVHVLKPLFNTDSFGVRPFMHLRQGLVNHEIKRRMRKSEVAGAMNFSSHDFRRGHARDLQESNAPLCDILKAGQWRSPAFKTYMDQNKLDTDAFLKVHVADSSSDDEPD